MTLSKKDLEIALSQLRPLKYYKPNLEQYPTPGDLAAQMLWVAFDDINDKVVADFGTGNGILAIGAALLGAKKVYAIDIDEDCLNVARENASDFSARIQFIHADVTEFNTKVDTVVMNPPFGLRSKQGDRVFLQKAFSVADTVYSIHAVVSESFLKAFSRDNGFSCELLFAYNFPISNIMPFHEKNRKFITVGVWRFKRLAKN